ncbi:Histidine-specific methyltransferase EgtD [Thiomonas sp. X19]|uniref:L-histidine N(alpha)-methyltransferase n=1 Tax=Thiomonas sp. X19 TaxID=1050370 RepID=UPI000B6412AE|nr:L-histidine N(alpha)-methyltransferase [Thiomonas sp. X19]SCC95079.1 Histidine-specific methyltransferase EgtD [Thiomonas sp. X19]
MKHPSPVEQTRFEPEDMSPPALRRAVLDGLLASPKHLPSAYLYDARGSALFEQICTLPEYYPTRTERAILQTHAGEMAARIGPRAVLVEPGSGAGVKTALLLAQLQQAAAYVPVEISPTALEATVQAMVARFPQLPIHPQQADFTQAFTLPPALRHVGGSGELGGRVVFFFPGSTIGNFDPQQAQALLARWRLLGGADAGLLIGIDLRKDVAVLQAAYDDVQGVTAAFNRNLLVRINREFGADFVPDAFDHLARYDTVQGRIEMHLQSREAQAVHLAGHTLRFDAGETIHTENSYKYTLDGFAALAGKAGWQLDAQWTDPLQRFGVLAMRAA